MSLIVSRQPRFKRRGMKVLEHRPVSPRWKYVLELSLAGASPARIQELTGYSPSMMYRILADPRIVAVKQQMMRYYDDEFERLYPKVIQAVRENLDHDDPKVRNDAAKTWLKAHGKFTPDQSSNQVNVTAEEVVFQILNQQDHARQDAE